MQRSHITSVVPLFDCGEEKPKFIERTQRVKKKQRRISEPNQTMRRIHARLVQRLSFLPVNFSTATGGIQNTSSLENAYRHRKSTYFYQTDTEGAYPNMPTDRLAEVLARLDPTLGSVTEIMRFLKAYCSGKSGGLATGGPASPLLFNIYCSETIDRPLRELIRPSRGGEENILTRYIDDIVFSSTNPIPRILRKRIREVVEQAGFTVSNPKSKVLNIRNPKRPVVVTGVVITRRGELVPEESFVQKVEELLDRPPGGLSERELARLAGFRGYLAGFQRVGWGVSCTTLQTENLYDRCTRRLEEYNYPKRGEGCGHQEDANILPERFVEQVREAADLKDIIEPHIQPFHKKGWHGQRLKKVGKEFKGLCPFHKEKTPSFTVAPEKGFYHCFGCGAHGDAFGFVMKTRNVGFREAVLEVATLYGIPFPDQYKLK